MNVFTQDLRYEQHTEEFVFDDVQLLKHLGLSNLVSVMFWTKCPFSGSNLKNDDDHAALSTHVSVLKIVVISETRTASW